MNKLINIKKQMLNCIYSRTIIIVFALILFFIHPLKAQHYLTAGLGYSIGFLNSDELSQFKDSYNDWYAATLSRPLAGFSPSVGIRWFLEYRHMDRLNTAVSVGSQNYSSRDDATWVNAVREFKLEVRGWFIEAQLGRTINEKFFVNGVLTVFFKKDVTLGSVYNTVTAPQDDEALTGTYEGITSACMDLGIAAGYFKDPLFIIIKITHPLFTGGGSTPLKDYAKHEETGPYDYRTYTFPDDYYAYMTGDGFSGVKGDIDGWKIMISASAGLKIKN